MTLDEWTKALEKTRQEIVAAPSDREALLVAFTELAILLLDVKATIEERDAVRT